MTNEARSKMRLPGTIYRGTLEGSIDAFGRVKVRIQGQEGIAQYARYYPGYYGTGQDFTHFIGGMPQEGTPVTLAAGDGGEYFIVSTQVRNLPKIEGDSLLIQSDDEHRINLSPSKGISVGNSLNKLRIHPTKSIVSDNFDTKYNFSEASLSVEGVIKRDLNPKSGIDHRESLEGFEDDLKTICLDPSVPERTGALAQSKGKNSNNASRNYPFVEKREIVYEFAHSTGYSTDEEESLTFDGKKKKIVNATYDRREARTDTLSLSLVAPNILMETVKGTVVDVYGNILDINRNIIPAGKEKDLTFRDNTKPIDVFRRLRNIERKSIAYHFEINSRKAPENPRGFVAPPDIDDSDNYSRSRSRFFMDVDKEGQLKVNVPASSETGNISLLARYENYSTIKAKQRGENPDNLPFEGQPENKDLRRDIFLDSFAFLGGTITIDDSANDSAFVPPYDRIGESPMKHGTAYHDITQTLKAHRSAVTHPYEPQVNTFASIFNSAPKNYVSTSINVSGDTANAGGRSGNFNFDGSIEINAGANTVDKQSVWLDTQGSFIGNIGRDNNHVSMGLSMTGDLLIEVGGSDVYFDDGSLLAAGDVVTTDPRFAGKNFAWRPGAVDIRVWDKNHEFTVVRIDNDGVSVSTPGHVAIVANQSMTLKAHTFINMEAERVLFWGTDPSSTRELIRNNKSIL